MARGRCDAREGTVARQAISRRGTAVAVTGKRNNCRGRRDAERRSRSQRRRTAIAVVGRCRAGRAVTVDRLAKARSRGSACNEADALEREREAQCENEDESVRKKWDPCENEKSEKCQSKLHLLKDKITTKL